MQCPGRTVSVQRDGPSLRFFIVCAAQESCTGPIVQLHRLHIGFEPGGELVLRNVGRPVRRERHVGQVIDVHLIVQGERMITLAPVVPDARLAIDDQRIDAELRETRRDRQPGLTAADDQHGGVAVLVDGGSLAQIEPIGSAEITRIGLALRPRLPDMLLVALYFVERRQKRPGLSAPVAVIRNQPQDSAAAALQRLEREDRLHCGCACARDAAWRGAIGINPEIRRSGPSVLIQLGDDRIRAFDRANVPCERQHIAPIALVMEQRLQRRTAGLHQCAFELREPIFHDCGEVFRSIQHSRRPKRMP